MTKRQESINTPVLIGLTNYVGCPILVYDLVGNEQSSRCCILSEEGGLGMVDEFTDFKSERVKYKSFAAQIVDQIDELIAMGHLAPGDPLPPERDLAKRFGVSRPTINEALSALESQGVIVRKMGSGTFVNQEIPESVLSKCLERFVLFQSCSDEDLVLFREALEPEIAALAAENSTPEDLAFLREDLLAIERKIQNDPGHQAESDVGFHLRLAEASKNRLFVSVLIGIQERIELWIDSSKMDYMEQGLEIHRRIYEAVAAGDPKAARKAMRDHMELHRKAIGLSATAKGVDAEDAKGEEVMVKSSTWG